VTKASVVLIAALVATLAAGPRSSADDLDPLRQEITQLRAKIAPLATPLLENGDIVINLSMAPLTRLFVDFAAASQAERSIVIDQLYQHGQLAGADWDCKIGPIDFGDGGWFVELKPDTVKDFKIELELSKTAATWNQANGLTIQTDYRAYAGVATFHGHFDPCVGGGVGILVGPVHCNLTGGLTANGGVSGAGGRFRYATSFANVGGLKCEMWAGSIAGNIKFFIPTNLPNQQALSGDIDGFFKQEGKLETKNGPVKFNRDYALRVTADAFTYTPVGIRAQIDTEVIWK
jgi:hypothetical protein